MSDEMLSQDEIDALLKKNQSSGEANDEPSKDGASIADASANTEDASVDDYLSAIEQDALGEIGNISFGSSSTALSVLLNQKVDITTPQLSVIATQRLAEEFPKPHVAVHVKYKTGFKGLNLLVIKMEDAAVIADLMLGGDGTSPDGELNDMHLSAVQEAMNQMMGSAATSMSTMFNERVDISPPGIDIFDATKETSNIPLTDEDVLLQVSFRMKVGTLIDSTIMQLIPVPFAKEMAQTLLNPMPEAKENASTVTENDNVASDEARSQEAQPTANRGAAGIEQNKAHVAADPQHHTGQVQRNTGQVQNVQFPSFDQDTAPAPETRNLDLLMDIPLQVTVELGRTKRVIKDILELAPGSIIELEKLAGEPVDILVNNKPVAKGEVVVIEENFGVRVTDILSQWDRLQKIQ